MEENNNQNKPSKEDIKKRKARKRKRAFRATIVYIAFILTTSVLLSWIAITLGNDLFAFVKEDKEITIVLPEDATISSVASSLGDAGVIEYELFFTMFLSLTAKDDDGDDDYGLIAGTHVLNSNMDYRGILNALQMKTPEYLNRGVVTVSIPEGYTIEQIGERLEENNVVTKAEFLDAVVNHEFNYDFITENEGTIYKLEGYLFPDTYEFFIEDDPVSVIDRMLNNYGGKVYGEIEDKALELGYTLHEITTIASLIEREAAKLDEQAKISGVIHNRLDSSSAYPYLNIDATIQYAVGHKEELFQSDLEIDSPYNSYTKTGLPPGPIASPGLNALLAAVNPEVHDYYFYVAKPDGYHIFTSTLDEHNQAVEQARSMQ